MAAVAAGATLGLALCVLLVIGVVRYQQLVTAQQDALRHAEIANADLQEALGRLRDQFGAANQALNSAQRQLASLNDEAQKQRAASDQVATSKTDRIAQLNHALDQAQRELHLAEVQRVTLMARLNRAEVELSEGQSKAQQAQSGVEQWQKKIQALTTERDKVAGERDHLRARIGELEARLPQSQAHQPPRPTAQAAPPVVAAAPQAAVAPQPQPVPQAAVAPQAAPEPARQVAVVMPPVAAQPAPAVAAQPAVATAAPHAVPAVATGRLAQVERVLASAGVDVAHLFAHYGMRTGEGGPVVPVPRDGKLPTLSQDQLTALSRLVTVLPVSAPLASYRLGSPFGVRGDPMNGRHEFHTGIDMLAPYMTPVYATAPGMVIYAGYRDDYGKIVEIDHGNGIATRYAHLHRYVVSVGERVAAHTQIGFLGSSGRATGPHVHYEVLVNGEPQDPEKFLGLAHLVPVAQH